MTPASSSPMSSRMPNLTAAKKPITDHTSGSQRSSRFGRAASSSMPKVKIVVGQGTRPNIGARG